MESHTGTLLRFTSRTGRVLSWGYAPYDYGYDRIEIIAHRMVWLRPCPYRQISGVKLRVLNTSLGRRPLTFMAQGALRPPATSSMTVFEPYEHGRFLGSSRLATVRTCIHIRPAYPPYYGYGAHP